MNPAARYLVFHGAIVLLFGLMLGAPYARAIKRNAAIHIVNAWRVAHLSLPIGAILMFSIAALLPALSVAMQIQWGISIALIVSAYGFCLSTSLAAMTGERGLSSGGKGIGKLVYFGNLIGAVFSIMAAGILLYAAFVSL